MITDTDITRHDGLIRLILARMYRNGQIAGHCEQDDLMQVGRIAVWHALERHDPARAALSTYIAARVWGEIMHHQRETGRANGWHRVHGQVAQIDSLHRQLRPDEDQTVGDTLTAPDDTERTALNRVRLARMHRIARSLNPTEQAAARCVLTDGAQREVIDMAGCSQMHASRLCKRVRAKLAAA